MISEQKVEEKERGEGRWMKKKEKLNEPGISLQKSTPKKSTISQDMLLIPGLISYAEVIRDCYLVRDTTAANNFCISREPVTCSILYLMSLW